MFIFSLFFYSSDLGFESKKKFFYSVWLIFCPFGSLLSAYFCGSRSSQNLAAAILELMVHDNASVIQTVNVRRNVCGALL